MTVDLSTMVAILLPTVGAIFWAARIEWAQRDFSRRLALIEIGQRLILSGLVTGGLVAQAEIDKETFDHRRGLL